jgi:hypothetical protein
LIAVGHKKPVKQSAENKGAAGRTGHPSKGGNGQGTSKVSLTPAQQNDIRRAAKRGKKPTGLSEIAQNPHVGATKAARAADWKRRQSVKRIADTREAIAYVARSHPEIVELKSGSPARRAADMFLDIYASTPAGTDPRLVATEKTKAAFPSSSVSAVFCGIARAKNAIDEAFSLTTAPELASAG